MNIRPATAEDIAAVSPRRETCRALVAEDNGRRLAVFGIYPFCTRWVLFAWATDEYRKNRRAVVAGIKALRELIANRPIMPLLAHADPEIPGSDVLLKHMGFEPLSEGIYQCLGNKQSRPRSR